MKKQTKHYVYVTVLLLSLNINAQQESATRVISHQNQNNNKLETSVAIASPANDCILNAIDLTSLINGVSLPTVQFNCRAADVFSAAGNLATRQDLTGDPNGCEICNITCTAKNADHRDIWYKFTVSAATPSVWLTAFNAAAGGPTFASAIYSGVPTGICGAGNIGGMTQIDCSAGDITPVCVAPCADGGGVWPT